MFDDQLFRDEQNPGERRGALVEGEGQTENTKKEGNEKIAKEEKARGGKRMNPKNAGLIGEN